jgi:hypothetical protein
MSSQTYFVGPAKHAKLKTASGRSSSAWRSLDGHKGGYIQIGTDQYPCTIYIYHQRRGGVGPVLEVRLDKAERIDDKGRSYSQEYLITPCVNGYARFFSFGTAKGTWHEVVKDSVNGRWPKADNKTTFVPGPKKKFIDPDF